MGALLPEPYCVMAIVSPLPVCVTSAWRCVPYWAIAALLQSPVCVRPISFDVPSWVSSALLPVALLDDVRLVHRRRAVPLDVARRRRLLDRHGVAGAGLQDRRLAGVGRSSSGPSSSAVQRRAAQPATSPAASAAAIQPLCRTPVMDCSLFRHPRQASAMPCMAASADGIQHKNLSKTPCTLRSLRRSSPWIRVSLRLPRRSPGMTVKCLLPASVLRDDSAVPITILRDDRGVRDERRNVIVLIDVGEVGVPRLRDRRVVAPVSTPPIDLRPVAAGDGAGLRDERRVGGILAVLEHPCVVATRTRLRNCRGILVVLAALEDLGDVGASGAILRNRRLVDIVLATLNDGNVVTPADAILQTVES